MGCFDSTCAITRTAIHHGDLCYLFWWPNEKRLGETYIPMRSTYEGIQSFRKTSNTMARLRLFLDRDDGLPPVTDEELDALPLEWDSRIKHYVVLRGTYNDYGWLDEYPENDDFREEWRSGAKVASCFFVHASIVEYICNRIGVDINGDPLDVARAIHVFAHIARIQLYWPDLLLGAQYFDQDELLAQSELLLLTANIIRSRAEYLRDELDAEIGRIEETLNAFNTARAASSRAE